MRTTSKKSIAVFGMIVANVERHLLPAQIVQIQEGDSFTEKASYFLPYGKALARAAVARGLEDMGVPFSYAEDLEYYRLQLRVFERESLHFIQLFNDRRV
jgi:hypothetical protein